MWGYVGVYRDYLSVLGVSLGVRGYLWNYIGVTKGLGCAVQGSRLGTDT